MIPYISFSGVFVFVYGLHRDGNIELLKAAGYVGRINHFKVDLSLSGLDYSGHSFICMYYALYRLYSTVLGQTRNAS